MDGGDQITKPQSHQMIKIKIKGDCETSIPKRESSAVAPIEEQREVVLTKLLHAMPPPDPNLFAMLKSLWRKMDAAALLQFLVSKQKESASLQAEIAAAMEEAVEEFLKSKVVEFLEMFVVAVIV
ncbi:hypothetical protein JHK87_012015 [Glycine soja]|nr:hypothetical protein JHK87_012015 [Glycine soja]